MDKAMQQVINQFPEREDCIRQLWEVDEDFQELCHDYDLCLEILNRWTPAAAAQRMDEYLSLRRRLEFEIEMKTQNGRAMR